MEPKNILVVDDEVDICLIFEVMLTDLGYQVVTESDPRKVPEFLRQKDFDVAVFDLVMPQMDGLDLIEEVRKQTTTLPILVVTGYGSADTTVQAMRRGATDFVTKPVDAQFLDLRIRRAFDIELSRRLANTDGLTGLCNHRHLHERLAQEIERAGRYDRPLSLIMGDLDNFKAFNDANGHPRGDELLILVAQTLRQASRSADIVARYGGEEFTLILPETPATDAGVLAERVRQSVDEIKLGGDRPISISLGVASHEPGMSQETLIQAADAALYRAKRQGRNRVCIVEGAGDTDKSAGQAKTSFKDIPSGELSMV